jgi:hypothetical protein
MGMSLKIIGDINDGAEPVNEIHMEFSNTQCHGNGYPMGTDRIEQLWSLKMKRLFHGMKSTRKLEVSNMDS